MQHGDIGAGGLHREQVRGHRQDAGGALGAQYEERQGHQRYGAGDITVRSEIVS